MRRSTNVTSRYVRSENTIGMSMKNWAIFSARPLSQNKPFSSDKPPNLTRWRHQVYISSLYSENALTVAYRKCSKGTKWVLTTYTIFGHIRSTKNVLEYKLRNWKDRFRYFYGQYLIAPEIKNVYPAMDTNGLIKMQTRLKMDRMEVKDTKRTILRQFFHLGHCKSITWLRKWLWYE